MVFSRMKYTPNYGKCKNLAIQGSIGENRAFSVKPSGRGRNMAYLGRFEPDSRGFSDIRIRGTSADGYGGRNFFHPGGGFFREEGD
jgi:hypothetical protein